jgi:hypothetical protein
MHWEALEKPRRPTLRWNMIREDGAKAEERQFHYYYYYYIWVAAQIAATFLTFWKKISFKITFYDAVMHQQKLHLSEVEE